MMGTSKVSAILLLVLGVLVAVSVACLALSEWEWWTLLLVLSSMAFVVGLVLFTAQTILRRSARS
jgi:uncharacterized membrane protein YcfT